MAAMSFSTLPGIRVAVLTSFAFATAQVAAAKPPSSLKPKPKAAQIVVSFAEKRVTSCRKTVQQARAQCLERTAFNRAGAELRFVPVSGPKGDPRKTVTLRLAPQHGQQQKSLRLAPGSWAVDWVDSQQRRTLRVGSDEQHQVRLRRTVGACIAEGGACRLDRTRVRNELRVD